MFIKFFSLSATLVLAGCVLTPISNSIAAIRDEGECYVVGSPNGQVRLHIPKENKKIYESYEKIRLDGSFGGFRVTNHFNNSFLHGMFPPAIGQAEFRRDQLDSQKAMLARALAHAPEYALKPAYQVRTFQHNGWHIRSSCRPDVNFTCVLEADRQAGSTLVALRLQRATIAYAPDPVDKNLKKEDFTGFFRPSPSAKTMADGSVIAGDQKWVKIHFDPEGELAALLDRLDSIRVE